MFFDRIGDPEADQAVQFIHQQGAADKSVRSAVPVIKRMDIPKQVVKNSYPE